MGVTDYAGRLSPEDKHARVKMLQGQGAVVAMVGDGVNDAPVLAQAQLSIAMGSGAILSQAQSDLVLLSGQLGGLLDALHTSRRTMVIVRQNLAWAIAYNVVALPLAMAGYVTPWMAGIGMAASSLLVVLNALRLTRSRVSGEHRGRDERSQARVKIAQRDLRRSFLPLQGGGEEGDGGNRDYQPHPHPSPPLEGEGSKDTVRLGIW